MFQNPHRGLRSASTAGHWLANKRAARKTVKNYESMDMGQKRRARYTTHFLNSVDTQPWFLRVKLSSQSIWVLAPFFIPCSHHALAIIRDTSSLPIIHICYQIINRKKQKMSGQSWPINIPRYHNFPDTLTHPNTSSNVPKQNHSNIHHTTPPTSTLESRLIPQDSTPSDATQRTSMINEFLSLDIIRESSYDVLTCPGYWNLPKLLFPDLSPPATLFPNDEWNAPEDVHLSKEIAVAFTEMRRCAFWEKCLGFPGWWIRYA